MRRSALVAMFFLGSALAWANPRLLGTLVRVNTKTGMIVIKTQAGNKAIQVQSRAHIEQHGNPSRLGNFHVGDEVEVEIGGTLSNDPLIGVAVYDTATAASLPAPTGPSGVYGEPVGNMVLLGGVSNVSHPSSVAEGLGAGPTAQNMAKILDQSTVAPGTGPASNGIGQAPYGPYALNPNQPFQVPPQYGAWQSSGPQYAQPNTSGGGWQQPGAQQPYAAPAGPSGGWAQPPAAQPLQAPNGGWAQPATAPQQAPNGGWAQPPATQPQTASGSWQQPPSTAQMPQSGNWQASPQSMPQAPNTGAQAAWTANPTNGWTGGSTMGMMGTVDGVIRNIDPVRNMLFVAPSNGSPPVSVRLSFNTPVQNQQQQSVPFNQIRLGAYVHVVGFMSGGSLMARNVSISQ